MHNKYRYEICYWFGSSIQTWLTEQKDKFLRIVVNVLYLSKALFEYCNNDDPNQLLTSLLNSFLINTSIVIVLHLLWILIANLALKFYGNIKSTDSKLFINLLETILPVLNSSTFCDLAKLNLGEAGDKWSHQWRAGLNKFKKHS